MSKVKRQIKKERVRKSKEQAPNGQSIADDPICRCGCKDKYAEEREELLRHKRNLQKEYHHNRTEVIECGYPENADQKFKIILDNGAYTTVKARVFMSIRQFAIENYQSDLETTVKALETNCDLNLEKIQSLMLEHKDAMMKKETEWLTKMENEKIELGKQIAIRDQMVLEARAETNEYKSMNQSILSQISDKEAKIAQVGFPDLATITRNQLF